MSLPDGAEYWWPRSLNDKERKPKTEARKERELRNIVTRRAYKKAHPELTHKQIQKLALKMGGYDNLFKSMENEI